MLTVLVAALLQVTPSPLPSASPMAPALPSVSSSPTPVPVPAATPAPLVATPSSVGIHPGAIASVHIANAVGALAVSTNGTAVTVTVDQAAQSINVVAGEQSASTTLHVMDSTGAAVDVPVLVAPDAGALSPAITLKVTGTIDPQWLASTVASAVANATTVQKGANLRVAPVASPVPPPPGGTVTIAVPVTIAGNGSYLDVAGKTTVDVTNVATDPFAPPLLYYDDDPEHVAADGISYRGTIAPGTPARLYYYHDDAGDPRRIAVILSAASDPASVQVIDSTAGPNLDVMSVGHAVSRDFLEMKPRNEGVVYDVAPGAPLVLHDLPMTARQGVAGSVGFNVIAGGPVTVTVLAVSPGVDPRTLLNGPMLPRDGHHRTGVFDITNFGTQSLAYVAGGADASVVYGDRQPTPPSADPNATGHDYGDYGVIHTFLISLSNPTSAPVNAYLYERPLGGDVRSSFVVDGNLVQLGCVRERSQRYEIGGFSLASDAHYLVKVQTMTDGGSNYPLEFGVTDVAPQPTTPPISAPDGCFPKPQAVPAAPPQATPMAQPTATP